jgi:hypothetical protein
LKQNYTCHDRVGGGFKRLKNLLNKNNGHSNTSKQQLIRVQKQLEDFHKKIIKDEYPDAPNIDKQLERIRINYTKEQEALVESYNKKLNDLDTMISKQKNLMLEDNLENN